MSFITDYLEYSTGNEAPEMFHVWGGYVCLSVAVGRQVWLPFEDVAIYPNIYVMYVGAAGNGKSWAMQKAKRLIVDLPDVQVSGSLETPPGLWRFMTGDETKDPPVPSPVKKVVRWPDGVLRDTHPMTIIANEFVNFISLDETGWINALNDIYDEDVYRYRTKNQGEDLVIGPYIVLLGALTTEVSNDLQKARIISTGLARRTIFQYGERKWHAPVARPGFTEAQRAARERCVAHLKKLQKLWGPFRTTDEVDDWWIQWYEPHLAEVPQRSPQLQGWYATKSIQVQKLAMLTALGEAGTLDLEIKHFEVALAFLEEMESGLDKIFGGVGRNELAAVAQKIEEHVAALTEPISEKELKTRFFGLCKPPNDYSDCLDYLLNSGKLQRADMTLKLATGEVKQTVLGTPKLLQEFAVRVQNPKQSSDEALPALRLDAVVVTDPSPSPVLTPVPPAPEARVSVESSAGTASASPPSAAKDQG